MAQRAASHWDAGRQALAVRSGPSHAAVPPGLCRGLPACLPGAGPAGGERDHRAPDGAGGHAVLVRGRLLHLAHDLRQEQAHRAPAGRVWVRLGHGQQVGGGALEGCDAGLGLSRGVTCHGARRDMPCSAPSVPGRLLWWWAEGPQQCRHATTCACSWARGAPLPRAGVHLPSPPGTQPGLGLQTRKPP